MKLGDNLKLAVKALADRKVRSALTIVGIAVGSAIILALVASTTGLTAGIAANIERTGVNVLTIMPARAFYSAGASSDYRLSSIDVTYLQSLNAVQAVYPYYSWSATIGSGSTKLSATIVSIDLSALHVLYKGLAVGQGIIPVSGDPTSAVLGYNIANPASGTPVGLNQVVAMTISGLQSADGGTGTSYSVLATSILTQYGSSLFSNIDDTIFISLQAGQFLSRSPYFRGIYVVATSTDVVSDVQDTITTFYGDNARVISPGQILSSITSITSTLTLFLGGIGAVSLLVATVGITNTMYVSVMERTREIGILKALGFRPRQIMNLFLAEAALTGMIGGTAGLGLGIVLAYLMGGLFGGLGGGGGRAQANVPFGGGGSAAAIAIQPVFSTELILFCVLFPIILAILAGLYPAWRASRMNAVKALKYE
jgi:putative ABC transport system permease protein